MFLALFGSPPLETLKPPRIFSHLDLLCRKDRHLPQRPAVRGSAAAHTAEEDVVEVHTLVSSNLARQVPRNGHSTHICMI